MPCSDVDMSLFDRTSKLLLLLRCKILSLIVNNFAVIQNSQLCSVGAGKSWRGLGREIGSWKTVQGKCSGHQHTGP